MDASGLLQRTSTILEPLTSWWLGLPAVCIIPLVFGVLRKELALILLGDALGTFDFSSALSPVQMVVFTLVSMLYIPCLSTIAALLHEFGVRRTLFIVVVDVALALLVGGIAHKILSLVM
jgi:ferrous iron transport protein B